jgi:hypothetical protein
MYFVISDLFCVVAASVNSKVDGVDYISHVSYWGFNFFCLRLNATAETPGVAGVVGFYNIGILRRALCERSCGEEKN